MEVTKELKESNKDFLNRNVKSITEDVKRDIRRKFLIIENGIIRKRE